MCGAALTKIRSHGLSFWLRPHRTYDSCPSGRWELSAFEKGEAVTVVIFIAGLKPVIPVPEPRKMTEARKRRLEQAKAGPSVKLW